MFKRPRLRPTSRLVNAGLATSMIFLAACGGDPAQTEANIENNQPQTTQNTPAENTPNTPKLQAVWSSSPLTAPIINLAFAGGPEPILAAVLQTGDIQLFNLLADRITSPIALDVKALATGQAVVLNEAALTLFPGIGTNGDINFYAYASALGEPIALEFLTDINASGLCAGTPLDDTSVMQLAYWTEDQPTEIVHGHVRQNTAGELAWAPIETLNNDSGPISACIADAQLQVATQDTAVNMALMTNLADRYIIAQTRQGTLNLVTKAGETLPAPITNGITVRVPEPITAMAGLSTVLYGNYPNGVIVAGGMVNGAPHIVFIEPE